MIKKVSHNILVFSLVLVLLSFYTMAKDKDGGRKNSSLSKVISTNASGKNGDSYRLNINNISLPMNNRGIIAAVNIAPDGSGGQFAGNTFLFSSGFFLSGGTKNEPWMNGVASASLIEDYIPGTYQYGENDSRNVVYVVKKEDAPFSQSWQDWKDAVALGADFYDGDGDGVYNPVDKNGNGIWDKDEDMPDLIGDETVWTVYCDNKPGAQRQIVGTGPKGIEMRQSVFAFASKGAIGNIIFVRYRIKKVPVTGVPSVLDNVYFGVWADPDLGNFKDDLVGCDVKRNAGFVYNNGPDAKYGDNPPCFLIDFFSGPVSYIAGVTYTDNNGNGVYDDGVDTPLDTAYSVRGQLKGIQAFPGAKNLGLSSFVHYQQGAPPIQDPQYISEVRNYMLGLASDGTALDPCSWSLGTVKGATCSTIDNKFWYSGDPVTGIGWINKTANDQRMMQNTGPFTLEDNKETEIVVAYVVGQGSAGALSSVTEAKRIDDGAQFIFDRNFQSASPAQTISPIVKTSDNQIDIYWDTYKQVSSIQKTDLYDIRFEGFNVYAYRTNSTQATVDGVANSTLLASYDVNDFIDNIYKENEDGIPKILYTKSSNQLDYNLYSDPTTGKIRLRITKDPFTGEDIVKGKEYYFAITSYMVNYSALYNMKGKTFGTTGDYALSNKSLFAEVENIPKIFTVTAGEDIYDQTSSPSSNAEQKKGASSGKITIESIDKTKLNGHTYEVSFSIDSTAALYKNFYSVTDKTLNKVIINNATPVSDANSVALPSPDGFVVKISASDPALGTGSAVTSNGWIDTTKTGFYYVSSDIKGTSDVPSVLGGLDKVRGSYLKADQIRKVVLKFGAANAGKAYRYLNGYIGSVITKRNSYVYAEGLTAKDTTGNGVVGQFGVGYVDVPFTAWVEDSKTGESRQLAVGFIEKSKKTGGNPDGTWNPDTNVTNSGEYILVFNDNYDPTGNQPAYKGGFSDGAKTVWAELKGYTVPAGTSGFSASDIAKAKSPFFNTLYLVGLSKKLSKDYTSGDKYVISVGNYPYTSLDKYEFTTNLNGAISGDKEKQLFEKINVYPNPLFGYNVATSYSNSAPDEPFVTFSNLPEEVTIKIYSLSGVLLRTLSTSDKSSPSSPFLRWNLQNESGLRVASGMYLAIVSTKKYGDKVLKFGIVMPQKQLPKY